MSKNLKIEKHNFPQKSKNKLMKVARYIGPGLVTGSADDDPSGIGTYSIAGAKYGLLLAWLIPFQLPLMIAIQEMCARIGIVTRKGLTANIKKFFPKPLLYGAVFILVFANIINIGADIAIMAESTKMILGCDIIFWAVLITFVIIFMEVFISYHVYSKILICLAVFLLAYVVTTFMLEQDWIEILTYTFIPHFKFNRDFILVSVGFIGTTISPYLFFWQTSQEVEDLHDKLESNYLGKKLSTLLKKKRIDTFVGMVFSQLIAFFIIITCFSSLHKNGITEITTASQAAIALKPLAGNFSFIIFTIGIIGAGFLGIPVLAGSAAYALAEIFNVKEGLSYKFREAIFFYSIIIFSTIAGLLINFIGIKPIKALLYAAIVNGMSAAPLIIFIIILANKKDLMGEHSNKFISNFFGFIALIIMFLSATLMFI